MPHAGHPPQPRPQEHPLIPQLVGGIGIFLLGMILLTDGLKAVAGGALRRTLERFTGGRISAMLSGAAVTALVQSSSATTLTTIGFVSAGLLTFPAAVGVIFGANLGTSSTGWIVSLLGLKLQIGAVALPLVTVGALLRLLGRGRWANVGLSLAGFGLIFVGIDLMQAGMATASTLFDPTRFPVSGLGSRLLLVGVGLAMTVVMQSSSAAIATTLTALYSGAITLEQGALMVIGQNVGTTVTAGLAALGASIPARRTALAHVLFNVLTGVVAFLILPFLLRMDTLAAGWAEASDPAVVLAAFHTTFNLMGVVLLLPMVDRLSRLVERMIPERGPVLGRYLDRSLVSLPPVAVAAARRTVAEVALVTTRRAIDVLEGVPAPRSDHVPEQLREALGRTRAFLRMVESTPESEAEFTRHLSVLHALDHQDRLVETLGERAPTEARGDLGDLAVRAAGPLRDFCRWLETVVDPETPEGGAGDGMDPVVALGEVAADVAAYRRSQRVRMLERTATGVVTPDEALLRIAAVRWGDRLVYHVWRTAAHLAGEGERQVGVGPGVDDPSGGARTDPPGSAPGAGAEPPEGGISPGE